MPLNDEALVKRYKFTEEEIANWPNEHKQCTSCWEILPFSSFYRNKKKKLGYNNACKLCENIRVRNSWYKRSLQERLWLKAKYRSGRNGKSFTIQIDDIVVPEHCPILGIKLEDALGPGAMNAPSLDRIDSSKGYVPGNVQVISYRANILKNNATKEEIQKLADWMNANAA